MNFAKLDAYLLSKKGATFDYPFDKTVRVYRVADKMFALTADEEPAWQFLEIIFRLLIKNIIRYNAY